MRVTQPIRNAWRCSTGIDALEARVPELQGQMGYLNRKRVDAQWFLGEEVLKTVAKESSAESRLGNGMKTIDYGLSGTEQYYRTACVRG